MKETQTNIFVDGDYLHYSIKSLGLLFDFAKFLSLLTQRFGKINSIRYYSSFKSSSDKQVQFLHYLEAIGFFVVRVPLRRIGTSKYAGTALDIQLAVDAVSISRPRDTVVLVTGDADFASLIATLKESGVRTIVMALPIVTSAKLKVIPDVFISLEELISEAIQTREVAESRAPVAADEKATEIFFLDKGLYYDNYVKVRNLLKSAKHHITIIDGYVNDEILQTASILNPQVRLRIITRRIEKGDFFVLLKKLKREGRDVDIYRAREFHDRFIRIDDDWWHLGHSIKDLGSGVALISKISEPSIVMKLRDKEEQVYETGRPLTNQ